MASKEPDDPEDQDDEPGPSSSKIPRLEHQNKVDRKEEIHYQLIAELKEHIFVKWSGYDKLLRRLRAYKITPKDIADCKESECNLFDGLERKGIIEVGKYDALLEVLEKENEPARKIIKSYQARIEKISRKEEDSRQKRDDEAGPSCSKSKKYSDEEQVTLSPALREIAERTLKRMNRHLSSNTFVQTQAVIKGKQLLDENKVLIYTGLPGEGKTENALCVLNLIKQENPKDIYLKLDSLSEWTNVNPNLNLVILLDDCFGKTNAISALINDNEKWKDIESCIKEGKVRIILTIRKHIFVNNRTKLENNGTELIMKRNVIDLSTEDFCLTKENKKDLLVKHCQSRNIEICGCYSEENLAFADQLDCHFKISQQTLDEIVKTNCPIGFPYLCYLFFGHPKYTKQGTKFFEKPLEDLKIHISELASSDSKYIEKIQYCLMCYMVLKGGYLNLTNLDLDILDKTILSLGIKQPSEREKREAVEELNHRYLVGEYPIFAFKHQTILECVALCFAVDNIKMLLQLCSNDFILEFIRSTDYKKKEGEEVIILDPSHYILVIKRFLKNIMPDGSPVLIDSLCLGHPLMDDKHFVDLFINSLKSNEPFILQTFAFIYAVKHGKTLFIDELYNTGNVNMPYGHANKCLRDASRNGHTDTVKWLLDHNFEFSNVHKALRVAPTDTLTVMMKHKKIKLNQVTKVLTDSMYCEDIGKHCDHKTIDVMLKRWPKLDTKCLLNLLEACIRSDNDKTVSFIFTKKPDIATKQRMSECLRKACLIGSIKLVKLIISKMPNIVSQQIMNECFTLACITSRIEILDFLLDVILSDNDTTTKYLRTCGDNISIVNIASYFGQFETVMKILNLDVNIRGKTWAGRSPLSYAILGYTNYEILEEKLFLKIKDELFSQFCKETNRNFDQLPQELIKEKIHLYSFKIQDYRQLFYYLTKVNLSYLTDLDMILDEHGSTLAHYCVLFHDVETIQLLIKKYKKIVFSKTNENLTCLHIAAFFGLTDTFELLVKTGMKKTERDKSGRSVLQYAMLGYSFAKCLQTGQKIDSNLLSFYCASRHLEVVVIGNHKYLLHFLIDSVGSYLTDLDMTLDEQGSTLAHYCVLFYDVETIQLLINRYKKIVFSKTSENLTCLHIAAFFGLRDIFELLVKTGLDKTDRDKSGRSVLQYAMFGCRYVEMNVYFFNKSLIADESGDVESLSPLYIIDSSSGSSISNESNSKELSVSTAMGGLDETNTETGERDKDSDITTDDGDEMETALNSFYRFCNRNERCKFGTVSKYSEIIMNLLKQDCYNITDLYMVLDKHGCTLAHYCVVYNSPTLIKALCDVHPNLVSIQNNNNHKPIDLAVLFGRDEIFDILYPLSEQNNEELYRLLLKGGSFCGNTYEGKILTHWKLEMNTHDYDHVYNDDTSNKYLMYGPDFLSILPTLHEKVKMGDCKNYGLIDEKILKKNGNPEKLEEILGEIKRT